MSGVYAAVGRIGRDAEVRQTGNGHSVAGFPVAVDVGFGDNKTTLWLDASLWGKRAEGGLVQYLTKGAQVFVQGEIGTREFQKRDGTPGFAVTLKVSELDLVGGQGGGQQQRQQPQQSYQQAPQQQSPGQQGAALYGGQQPGGAMSDDSEIPFMRLHNIYGG